MGTVACGDLSGMGYEVIVIRNAPRLVKQAVLKAKRAHTPERSVPRASSRATPYPAVLSDSGMLDAETIETKHLAKRRGILNVRGEFKISIHNKPKRGRMTSAKSTELHVIARSRDGFVFPRQNVPYKFHERSLHFQEPEPCLRHSNSRVRDAYRLH